MFVFWVLLFGLFVCFPARAEIVETFRFSDVASIGVPGDSENDARPATSAATSEYTLGSLSWSGTTSATPDPFDPSVFPSWGADLGLRLTHLPSGTQADIHLGSGEEFGAVPADFAGSSRALNGLQIAPGDLLLFEFFEGFDDPIVSPDAVWNTIEFSLSDDAAMPLGPPEDGVVRLSTIGRNTFPTGAGEDGAEFFRIEYGAGGGPAVMQSVLNTRAAVRDDVWFDSDEAGDSPDTQGTFQANLLKGVAPPLVSFEGADPNSAFAGDFAVLRLAFAPGEFAPGDAIHFGIDTDGGFAGPARGDAFAALDPPPTFTVLFDDGTLAASDLWQTREDLENAALIEIDIRNRRAQADFDADGDVDGDDLLDLLLHFGARRTATHAQGDTDGNGTVDRSDTATWRGQVGRGLSAIDPSTTLAVPEPGTAVAAAIILGCLALRRRIGLAGESAASRRPGYTSTSSSSSSSQSSYSSSYSSSSSSSSSS